MLQALLDPHYVIADMSGTILAFSSWLQDDWHSSEMPKFRDGRRGRGRASQEGYSSGSKSLSEVFPVRVLLTSLVRRCTTAREAWEMSSYFFLASVVEVGKRERVG